MILFMFVIGVITGYGLSNVKMWNCILSSWKTREIAMKLEGDMHDTSWTLGWLEGHRSIVRELDMSPWTWWRTRKRIVKEVCDGEGEA